MADQLSRRTGLAGAAAAGLALPLLAGCGSTGAQGGGRPMSSGGTAGTPLAKTSQIQVGGGQIFADQNVVVTQPSRGEFKAFSATCTHLGCQVASVSDGTINCPCHGSQFSISDGSVAGGPAPAPLPAMKITVSKGEITLES